MATYARSSIVKGTPFLFYITNIYSSKIIYGNFKGFLDKIPDVFEARYVIDEDGKVGKINLTDLQWFHCEDRNKLLIFDNFYLPHYVKPGDKLLYLQ